MLSRRGELCSPLQNCYSNPSAPKLRKCLHMPSNLFILSEEGTVPDRMEGIY